VLICQQENPGTSHRAGRPLAGGDVVLSLLSVAAT